jgi:hypothetical protein
VSGPRLHLKTPGVLDAGRSVGLAAAVMAVVTLLSLPPLWRLMRPDGLRTE